MTCKPTSFFTTKQALNYLGLRMLIFIFHTTDNFFFVAGRLWITTDVRINARQKEACKILPKIHVWRTRLTQE